jgi:hypothetical protein
MGLAVVYANDAPPASAHPMIYVLRIVVGCGWQKRQSSISINAELSSQQRHIGCADAGGASLAIDLAHSMGLHQPEQKNEANQKIGLGLELSMIEFLF